MMLIKTKWDIQNHSATEEKTTLVTLMTSTKTSFIPLKIVKNEEKADTSKDFFHRTVLKYCKKTSKKAIMI